MSRRSFYGDFSFCIRTLRFIRLYSKLKLLLRGKSSNDIIPKFTYFHTKLVQNGAPAGNSHVVGRQKIYGAGGII
ncbi:MAG: hypothetical protein IJR31_04580, partial [Lachnospiraceae bacterium]|nr:hypothetical protein [Lachnospiraceae bacterium]